MICYIAHVWVRYARCDFALHTLRFCRCYVYNRLRLICSLHLRVYVYAILRLVTDFVALGEVFVPTGLLHVLYCTVRTTFMPYLPLPAFAAFIFTRVAGYTRSPHVVTRWVAALPLPHILIHFIPISFINRQRNSHGSNRQAVHFVCIAFHLHLFISFISLHFLLLLYIYSFIHFIWLLLFNHCCHCCWYIYIYLYSFICCAYLFCIILTSLTDWLLFTFYLLFCIHCDHCVHSIDVTVIIVIICYLTSSHQWWTLVGLIPFVTAVHLKSIYYLVVIHSVVNLCPDCTLIIYIYIEYICYIHCIIVTFIVTIHIWPFIPYICDTFVLIFIYIDYTVWLTTFCLVCEFR